VQIVLVPSSDPLGTDTVPFIFLQAATAIKADLTVVLALLILPFLVAWLINNNVVVAKMTMIATTTKISIRVKAFSFFIVLKLL
jgi:hypothetical protein